MKVLLFTILSIFTSSVSANTLTAVCKNPRGYTIGDTGSIPNIKDSVFKDGKDKLNVQYSISIGLNDNNAHITTKSVQKVETEKGLIFNRTDNQIDFIVVYPHATWLYSIFPKERTLLISKHTNGYTITQGGAIASVFYSKCQLNHD